MVKIKKVKNGWLLYDSAGGYEKHSHFKNKKAAEKCLCLIKKRIMPNQPYFVESVKRLLGDKEFQVLSNKQKKENYYNVNNGYCRKGCN